MTKGFLAARLILFLATSTSTVPATDIPGDALKRFPGKEWETKRPADLGFDEEALRRILPRVGIGGTIVRHGYVVATWGNQRTAVQTASMGKTFNATCLGLAVDAGLVELDDLVRKTWTGEGENCPIPTNTSTRAITEKSPGGISPTWCRGFRTST